MSITPPKPLINGFEYQFASIVARVKNVPFFRILSINYEASVENAKAYGTCKHPISRTRGRVETTASIELLKSDLTPFLMMVTNGRMTGWADSPFEIAVSYADAGQKVVNDVLSGCVVSKIGNDHSEGIDALKVSIELSVMELVLDGFSTFADGSIK